MNVSIPEWLIGQEDNFYGLPSSLDMIRTLRKHYKHLFLQQGIPSLREERFKYTNFNFLSNRQFSHALRKDVEIVNHIHQYRLGNVNSILLVFVNGYFIPQLSDLNKFPAETVITNLHSEHFSQSNIELIAKHWPDHLSQIRYQPYPFATLNAGSFVDGLFCFLPDECEVTQPVHLLSIATGDEAFYAHPHHIIALGKNSKLTLVDEYLSLSANSYFMNVLLTVTVEQDAQLEYYKIQKEHTHAIHMAHTFIQQKQSSQVSMMHFSKGATFARDDIVVELQEKGATCHTYGYYQLNADEQYVDYHIDIQHKAPLTQSEMLYKGILNKKSRAVFNGRVEVKQHAQKILAHQANHNLILSKQAEVYSKPDLEIYADDVKCKHGATIGELDQEALFYIRSRGIDIETAIEILVQGFSEEIRQRISHPAICAHIEETCLC